MSSFDPQQPGQPQYGQPQYGQPQPGQVQPGQQPASWQPGPAAAQAPKKKNWFARHKLLTIAGAILLAIILMNLATGNRGGQSPAAEQGQTAGAAAEQSQDAGQQAAGQQAAADAAPAAAGIGTAVQTGDFSVTITGVEPGVAQVGSDVLGQQAQGQYVLVQVSVTNTGKTAETFLDSGVTLIDDQGREHRVDSSAALYLGEQSLMIQQINPGNTATGTLAFDIPADATPVTAILQSSMLAEKVEVALQ